MHYNKFRSSSAVFIEFISINAFVDIRASIIIMYVDILIWRVAGNLGQTLATILKFSGEFFWVKAKKSASLKPYSAVWDPPSIAVVQK